MSSIILIHSEETGIIPVHQAITKCRLFENNPALASSPYTIQTSVSLSVFREFISALEGNTIEINVTNFTGLFQLCEEFGFEEFEAKLSELKRQLGGLQEWQITSLLPRVNHPFLDDSFVFVVNGMLSESISISEAVALSLAVREQLSVDVCARKFVLSDSRIETADIHSLQLLLSGESISIGESQGLLSDLLGNVNLERSFLACSKANNRMNLSDLVMEKRIDLKSVDVSNLSVEALDSLLLSESISVESEDALLLFVLKLGPDYRDLLRHIQIRFLSVDGLSLLDEHFEIPSESVWQCAADRIAHVRFDSRIILNFPEIFAEFQGKWISLLWRGSRDGFGASEFHRRCEGHPTH
jgi:hypothetical protein